MVLRSEYPRPQFVREDWLSLNGEWNFIFDDANAGLVEKWPEHGLPNNHEIIVVPFPYQAPLSGINVQTVHPVVWYERDFSLPESWQKSKVLLNFGAVDYFSTVWVNGVLVGQNRGGYVTFTLDISAALKPGENSLIVRVEDNPVTTQPRGKQKARWDNYACWYTPVTGIWQSVWLESVADHYLQRVKIVPDLDQEIITIEYWLNEWAADLRLECLVSFEGAEVSTVSLPVPEVYTFFQDTKARKEGNFVLHLPQAKLWSPETPQLYDLNFRLYAGSKLIDEVASYVGMRKVHVEDGKVFLNNKPYYLRMILDQGFWPEGIYTPRTVEELRYDVEVTKELGFNGARKHQKFEDPYYYYYCDQLGLLTWCEMAAAYVYDEEVAESITTEWQRLVIEHYNFPSVIAWVPINESWGVDQLTQGSKDPRLEHHLLSMYHLTKSLDSTRIVVGNDGWQQTTTDLIAIHDYTQSAEDLKNKYDQFKANRYTDTFTHGNQILLPGYKYTGQPIMLTEFGGIKVEEQGAEGWGYGDAALDYGDMLKRLQSLIDVIFAEKEICGYCYTQLTDVEQEVNGLLTYDRQHKLDPQRFREIFGVNPK